MKTEMMDIDDLRFRELVEHGIPLERLEARLRPLRGSRDLAEELRSHDGFADISIGGFLGVRESLLEVVYSDWLVVERYGTGHQEIAAALEKAISARKLPNQNYRLLYGMLTLGGQTCPWECQSQYKRGINGFLIYDKKCHRKDIPDMLNMCYPGMTTPDDKSKASENRRASREEFAVVTEIHPHLIGEHYFFEGRESPYRAEPRILIEALGLAR